VLEHLLTEQVERTTTRTATPACSSSPTSLWTGWFRWRSGSVCRNLGQTGWARCTHKRTVGTSRNSHPLPNVGLAHTVPKSRDR